MIVKLAEGSLKTKYGTFHEVLVLLGHKKTPHYGGVYLF